MHVIPITDRIQQMSLGRFHLTDQNIRTLNNLLVVSGGNCLLEIVRGHNQAATQSI